MEKKLTDAEIVEALECCATDKIAEVRCQECILEEENGCCTVLLLNALDLIHRLQEENGKQQAEIERLKNFIDFKTANVMCDKCKEQAVKDTAKKVFNEVMSCIGSLQMFWIVDGKQQTVVDADKLFEKVGEIAKKHGICFDEKLEPKPAKEGKTITFPKFKGYEVE